MDKMDKYTYRVTWSEEDGEYVGLCTEFPSLSWLADTQEAALAGIRDTVKKVVQDMQSTGETIPQPLATKRYSGKFTVRVPPDVHRNLQIQAAESKVSVNRLVSAKLSEYGAGMSRFLGRDVSHSEPVQNYDKAVKEKRVGGPKSSKKN
jgi:predicted HicB family RNase H-like nuclease